MAVTAGEVAASLSRVEVQRRFQAPLRVLERLPDLAAWPVVNTAIGSEQPVAYAFESVDFAPIPGYEGSPVNLLVVVDGNGYFTDVEVLEQHEPMFVFSGLGDGPLRDFVRQYVGKNLQREIRIASGAESKGQVAASQGQHYEVIDGITKATATVRIVHKSILASALVVARSRLGTTVRNRVGPPAIPREDVFERLDFSQLLARGLVGRRVASHAEVERLFAGSEWAGSGADAAVSGKPQVDLYFAYLNLPTVGRALLGDDGYRRLLEKLEPGQAALWVGSAGSYSMLDEGFRAGGDTQRLGLAQEGFPLEMRDLVFDLPEISGLPQLESARIFTVFAEAGLDPARPIDLTIRIRRAKGMGIPRVMEVPVHLEYRLPVGLFIYPGSAALMPDWLAAWRARFGELAVIGASLVLLSLLLFRPQVLQVLPLRSVRLFFLVFTLVYLGWYAQGQLSIVQLLGALKSLSARRGVEVFLYDPVTLLLIAFTLLSLVLWGRGAFCGWLCPFGALQELLNLSARRLGVRQRRMNEFWLRRVGLLRVFLLAMLCLASLVAPSWGEALAELEPFKTTITVGFNRSWPYLTYAGLLLVLGMIYFRFFCRVLCPLGTALALGSVVRCLNWLPRRRECGKPCQTCQSRCQYGAIAADGAIRYPECFQCLECVDIFYDSQRCAPVLFMQRKGRQMRLSRLGK